MTSLVIRWKWYNLQATRNPLQSSRPTLRFCLSPSIRFSFLSYCQGVRFVFFLRFLLQPSFVNIRYNLCTAYVLLISFLSSSLLSPLLSVSYVLSSTLLRYATFMSIIGRQKKIHRSNRLFITLLKCENTTFIGFIIKWRNFVKIGRNSCSFVRSFKLIDATRW